MKVVKVIKVKVKVLTAVVTVTVVLLQCFSGQPAVSSVRYLNALSKQEDEQLIGVSLPRRAPPQ